MDLNRAINLLRRRRALAWLPVAGLALLLVALAFLQSDLPEDFGDLRDFAGTVLRRFGAPASLALLYLEESGIPFPVPGDVYVAYLGNLAAGSIPALVGAWLGVIAVVVAGASNLYLVSRRWGHRLVTHRLGAALHLDPGRVARIERWLARWGAVTIIFGRHLPGFRIPITVMAGTFEVRYRVFALSVAVSTAVWAGIWLLLGRRYGRAVAHLFNQHRWGYLAAVGVVVLVVAYAVARAWRSTGRDRLSGR
jgi:membrane-associated protein